jgi:hypothetical protein
MVACALEGHGIPALLLDDNICRIVPGAAYLVGGAKVVVDERNEEQALEVDWPRVFGRASVGRYFRGGCVRRRIAPRPPPC